MDLIHIEGWEWQKPVLTEQKAYELLKKDPLLSDFSYLAVPWSTLIDTLEFGSAQKKAKAQEYLSQIEDLRPCRGLTVCQHEKFHQLH